MLIHIQFELQVIIHIGMLICNLSAAMTPCNYEQTDS